MRAGIKTRGPDVALIVSDVPAAAAGVFTRSTVVGAPVTISRERVRSGSARAIAPPAKPPARAAASPTPFTIAA